MTQIELTINGEAHSVAVAEETPLLDVLRNTLGLSGSRFGCGLEQCGSCTVIVDGKAERACTTPVWSVAGKSVTTIEGIGTRERPHPLQRAFLELQAGQCGYCLAGILMASKALLDRNRSPSRAEIADALKGNICRCGTHSRILRAVERAAAEMRGQAVE
jgi:nicotinate dehydrogenase subunit A